MRTLILMRHGTAEKAVAGGRDFDRPLSERGRREAEAAGAALADEGWLPTVALVSPAVRTQETWEEVETAFDEVEKVDDPKLLHTTAEAVLAAAEAAEGEVVMVIGHNPGLGELMDALSRTGDEAARRDYGRGGCPPGAAAVFAVEEGRYSLESYIPPSAGR